MGETEKMVYRIAVLTDKKERGHFFSGWVKQIGAEYGTFPVVEEHEDLERFFYKAQQKQPEGIIIDLPGALGLNAAERLRALCPDCKLIWCSDLDFSLQAYRLHMAYFILNPVEETEIRNGLSLWFEEEGACKKRKKINNTAKAVTVNMKQMEEL